MDEDLLQLLIYIAIGIIGVIGSAYKNKMKRQQAASKPRIPSVPRNMSADPEKDFAPELGPLIELFDIPRPRPVVSEYETVESGPALEEAGMNVETEAASAELAGMTLESEGGAVEKEAALDTAPAEEGLSDIQKMIARYEAIHRELDHDTIQDDIAAGEIVSVEAEEEARAAMVKAERFFDPRKAIIYSEILKRREY